ncbi:MAG: FimV/HubP family polar landmark protein [Gemmatimonadota bacterium]
MTIHSALGQPLRADVEVTAVTPQEASSLGVRLASATAFRQANLEFNPALSSLRFTLDKRGDSQYIVRVSSAMPVNEPYLDLLIELTSSTGRVLREYTVLLDPPALKAGADVVAPVARSTAPAAATTAPAPAPAAAPAPAPAASAAPATRAPASTASTYSVKRGDTLGKIAQQTKPAAASLDQMLVSLFRANPEAFAAKNMNNLLAGSTLRIPAESETLAIGATDARREVAAQSADFAQYRSRLAQAATATGPSTAAAAGQGRVTTKVEDKGAAPRTGDQLKIAKTDTGGAGQATATKAGDEAVARERQVKELQQRIAELEQTNQKLQQALELQSKAGAQAQKAAEEKAPPAAPAPAPAPAPAAAPAPAPEPAAKAAAPAEAPKVEPAKPEAPKAEAPKPAPAPAEQPGFLQDLISGTSGYAIGGLAAAVVALLGFVAYRRRKSADQKGDFEMAEGLRGNSLFGQTGGQSVDTAATSTFNSSFIPSSSQLDSNEVDPVAEADVYIAYGREEQAEEILKEALRMQPDRHSARAKLLEIYSRRSDKASFNAVAQELKDRTGGEGEEWDRTVKLGRALDPSNALYGGSAAAAEKSEKGPTTELRLGPSTTMRGPTTAAMPTGMPMADLEQTSTMPGTEMPATVGLTRPTAGARTTMLSPGAATEQILPEGDSRLGIETKLPVESAEAPATRISPRDDEPTQLAGLDFELDALPPTKVDSAPKVEAPAAPAFEMKFEPTKAPPVEQLPPLPDLNLDLPPRKPEPAASAPLPPIQPDASPATRPPARIPGFDDTLSRPSLIGEVGALPEERAPRLLSNTDQATVPLIDFDLSGADVELGGRKTETPTGSPLAAQMATKLDLARGYIDLGVKDGARELLEEVMRDGTREQRQSAVELMKQVEN